MALSRMEAIYQSMIDGTPYNENPQSRLEYLTLELKKVIEEGGGGGSTNDYNKLINHPTINGEELIGDKTASDLEIPAVYTVTEDGKVIIS